MSKTVHIDVEKGSHVVIHEKPAYEPGVLDTVISALANGMTKAIDNTATWIDNKTHPKK